MRKEVIGNATLAYALLPRPLSPKQAALQRRLFLETIEPLQRMKVEIYSIYLPTIILDSNGQLVSAAYPDEAQELIKQLDAMIQQAADSWQSRMFA